MTPSEARAFTDAIAVWVRKRSDLKALGLTGSWSRDRARSDSDLDLLILSDAPEQYRAELSWLYHIALPDPFRLVSYRGANYGEVWSCHALLEPTAELELTFGAIDWASTHPIDAGTRRVISGGFRVILDKDGLLRRLVEAVQISNLDTTQI